MGPTRREFLATGVLGACFPSVGGAAPGADNRRLFAPAQDAVEKGLAYLAATQSRDGELAGAFGNDRYQGNIAITSLAALAFMSGGHQPERGRYGEVVERALRYVLRHADTTGFLSNPDAFTSHTKYGQSYNHGFATLFLAELHGMVNEPELAGKLKERLGSAVRLMLATQTADGGWRYQPTPAGEADVSVTAAQIMALRAARNAGFAVPRDAVERCAAYLASCQKLPEGGFQYMPRSGPPAFARSAAALVGLHCCGIYRGDELERIRPRIDLARDYLLAFLPSKRPRPVVEGHFLYGHYYAVQALRQAGGKSWHDWYEAIRDELCQSAGAGGEGESEARRLSDGSWTDKTHGAHYATALACIILQMPRNLVPIFQD